MSTIKSMINVSKGAGNPLTQVVNELENEILGRRVIEQGQSYSFENLNDTDRSNLGNVFNEITSSVESIANSLGLETEYTTAQMEAAAFGGVIGANPTNFDFKPVPQAVSTGKNVSVVPNIGLEDAYMEPHFGMEVYDERENQQATIFSITYNLAAAKQDEFAETFFPTITCAPDEVGFGIEVERTLVYTDIERSATGALDNFKKKNILRAIADPTVLKNDLTRLYPVVRDPTATPAATPDNTDKFITKNYVAPALIDNEGTSVLSAPLKIGTRLSLLAISQTDASLAKGAMDQTDALDPALNLEKIYIRIGADSGVNGVDSEIMAFNVEDIPFSNFTYSAHGNYRGMVLDFNTTSVLLDVDAAVLVGGTGAAQADVATIFTAPTSGTVVKNVRLKIAMTGSVDLETSELVVWGNEVSIDSMRDSTGALVSPDSVDWTEITGLFSASTIVGYTVKAFATNSNKRSRGQLLDVIRDTTLYNVPIRNSITAIHPPCNSSTTNDTSDLAALISATKVRSSNSAVETLVRFAGILSNYASTNSTLLDDNEGNFPEVLGTGRYLVIPRYSSETINVSAEIDSITSAGKAENVQAVLVNKIRDHIYRLYVTSEYKVAHEAIHGGTNVLPTVIIGTDPVIARYLTVTGDTRTLGNDFNVKIVSTLDRRIKGKMFVSFSVFDNKRNTTPNPLSFGNTAYCPVSTCVLPISRGGQISKELSVSPRFLHINNLPVMAEFTVTNIPEALGKNVFRTDELHAADGVAP